MYTWKHQRPVAYDIKGIEIKLGDLLRSPHFVGARRKQYYLYHLAQWNAEEQHLEAVPARDAAIPATGGRVWLTPQMADACRFEIIDSHYGPNGGHEDRPRIKRAPASVGAERTPRRRRASPRRRRWPE